MKAAWTASVWIDRAGHPQSHVSSGVVVYEDDSTVVLMRMPESEHRYTSSHARGEVFESEAEAQGEAVKKLVALRRDTILRFDSLIESARGLQAVAVVG